MLLSGSLFLRGRPRLGYGLLLALVFLASRGPVCGAAVIRVSTSGSDANDGLSWAAAKRTIAPAIESAGSGGEVWLAAGTYNDAVTVADTSLYGGFAGTETQRTQREPHANTTVLNASGAPAITTVAGTSRDVVIDGFTFTGFCNPSAIRCLDGSSPTITGNLFKGVNGSAVYASGNCSPLIANNVIASGIGAGIVLTGQTDIAFPIVVNNTIVLNTAQGVQVVAPSATIRNNIIAYNGGVGIQSSGGVADVGNNCLYANYSDYAGMSKPATDIRADPVLPRMHYGDYHIQQSSPCRDAGDGLAPGMPMLDFDGQLRPYGLKVDIGADESWGETYQPAIVRVNSSVTSSGPGDSWSTAYRYLGEALNVAAPGTEIWVAKGSYNDPVRPRAGLALYGGFAGTEGARSDRRPRQNLTIITQPVTTTADSLATTVVDGFTWRSTGSSMVECSGSPTISGNSFEPPGGTSTTGILCQPGSSPLLASNFISRCTYAIRAQYAWPSIVHNTITRCPSTTGAAVVAYLNSPDPSPVIANNIFAYCGSGVYASGQAGLKATGNCVFACGLNPYYGVTPSGGVSADPLLLGDCHIGSASPCISAAADLTGVGLGGLLDGTDIDGEARLQGALADIGADESAGEPGQPLVVRVRLSSPTDGPGTTWDNAYHTISAAMAASLPGAEIWVAAGTYTGTVTLPGGIALFGGFAGTETQRAQRQPLVNKSVLMSGTSGSVLINNDAGRSTVLDGFTLKTSGSAGAVISTGGSPTISGNVIDSCGIGIACISTGSPLITNNWITRSANLAISSSMCWPVIVNNTFAWNGSQTASTGAISVVGMVPMAAVIANNIFAFNAGYAVIKNSTYAPQLSHNCLWQNTYDFNWSPPPGTVVREDPQMVRMGAGDFHIQPGSPCRNTGDPGVTGLPSMDIDGQQRPQGLAPDIGADESYGQSYQSYAIRVRSNSTVNGPGDSWANAYRTIGAALNAALPGAEVWVAEGSYTEAVSLKNGVAVYGGFTTACQTRQDRDWSVHPTVINGSGVGCTSAALPSTICDGFVVSGGVCQIIAGSPTISRNVFTGGGLAVVIGPNASPLVTGNVITSRQGGILCGSTLGAKIIGNTITAVSGGNYPGIALASSNATVACNVVAGNAQGIAAQGTCSPTLASNCVFGNSGGDYLDLSPSATDIRSDPQLKDGWHLSAESPCVGSADPQYAGLLPDTDIENEPRQQGAAADIGADEFWGWAEGVASSRRSADGTSALVEGAVVTAAFNGFFYVEADSRACGLRVMKAGYAAQAGTRVDISGVMSTTGEGERALDASLVRPSGSGHIDPLIMRTSSVVGGNWLFNPVSGSGQRGMSEGVGLNPVGLLAQLSGFVTKADPAAGTAVVWDGSFVRGGPVKAPDGSSGVLVRFAGPLPEWVREGEFALVTGVVSCSKVGESYFPEVLVAE